MRDRADLLALFMLLSALLAWCAGGNAYANDRPETASRSHMTMTESLAVRPPGALPDEDGPSPVIFPEQTLPLRFDHQRHAKQLGMTCTTCHGAARTSEHASDSLLPPATRCDACHGTNHRDLSAVSTAEPRPLGQCGFCHVGYDPTLQSPVQRLRLPTPNLRFNHKKHVSDARMSCARCHGKVEELTLATRDQLPRMKECVTCHTLGQVGESTARPVTTKGAKRLRKPSGACQTCHLSDPSGRLTTIFASGKLLPPPWLHDAGHDASFVQRHKTIAGDDSRFCASCHQERFCVGCHDGNVRPRQIHPNDFLSQHPIAARQDNPRCTSCHQQQSFCLSCHQRTGVALSGPTGNFGSRGRFHPPKSVWTDGLRTPQHHAWEAQRNLNACVSCHQERDCALCHATRGVGGAGPELGGVGQGVNPHPVSFASRCQEALRQNARPCLTCHAPGDPDLLKCR